MPHRRRRWKAASISATQLLPNEEAAGATVWLIWRAHINRARKAAYDAEAEQML